MNFEETLCKLQDVYTKDGFDNLKQQCKQIALDLYHYPEPIFFPVKFDSALHQISSTKARDYLDFLTDGDVNAPLKQLRPVQIKNDNSAIFRAAAVSLDFSAMNRVYELKLRCLVNALSKLTRYINDNEEVLGSLCDPERISSSQWSNFVHEKDHVSEISSHSGVDKS